MTSGVDIAVAEVKRLQPEPGDVIVVRVSGKYDSATLTKMVDTVKGALPEGVKCLVADSAVTDVQLAKAVAEQQGKG